MKQFKNLHEAFRHQTKCPFCMHRTHLGIDQIESIYEHDRTREKVTLKTGSIQFVIDGHTNEMIACYSGGSLLSGVMMFGLAGVCTNCSQYSFTIGVSVDITNKIMNGLFLGSETFSVERDSILYEARNIYATNKTEYNSFAADKTSNGTAVLPLVPFDLDNPEKTFERIKGLLVFL